MVIQRANQTINELRHALPKGFVFVLDTTDRSFIYKSANFIDLEQKIVAIDKNLGIDQLTRQTGYHLNHHDGDLVGLKSIESNTYVGFCLPKESLPNHNRLLAETILTKKQEVLRMDPIEE